MDPKTLYCSGPYHSVTPELRIFLHLARVPSSFSPVHVSRRYLWNETECLPCPEGMYCPGNFLPAYQLAGYWVEHSDIGGLSYYSVFSCRDASRCPAGDPGQCNVGRTGRACADCFLGYASDVDGSCKPCDALSMWPFLLLPIVMLGLLPLLVAASILMSRARRVAVSIFLVCVIFGQLVVCLQSLEA